jgi:hypothetical protein
MLEMLELIAFECSLSSGALKITNKMIKIDY